MLPKVTDGNPQIIFLLRGGDRSARLCAPLDGQGGFGPNLSLHSGPSNSEDNKPE